MLAEVSSKYIEKVVAPAMLDRLCQEVVFPSALPLAFAFVSVRVPLWHRKADPTTNSLGSAQAVSVLGMLGDFDSSI